jgi:LacI family transcriptional regulator
MTSVLKQPPVQVVSHLHGIRVDRDGDSPLYAQVRDALEQLIDKEFAPGDAFYPENVLIDKLAVSRITVRRALDDLGRAGRLSRRRGRVTIVQGLHPRPAPTGADRVSELAQPVSSSVSDVDTISVIIPYFQSEYGSAMMEAVGARAKEMGLKLRLYNPDSSHDLPDHFKTSTSGPDREGVILFGSNEQTHVLYRGLTHLGYRSVAIEGVDFGYPGYSVATDAVAAVRIGLDHLLSLGHERIVLLVCEPVREASVVTKLDTFFEVMDERGLAKFARVVVCPRGHGRTTYDSAYAQMDEVWNTDPARRPSAIFTVSDPGAWAALRWFSESGVAVPRDVSVLGFEDALSSKFMNPSLSTVAHPIADVVARAVDVLRGTELPKRHAEWVTPTLVVRESTGPAPAN